MTWLDDLDLMRGMNETHFDMTRDEILSALSLIRGTRYQVLVYDIIRYTDTRGEVRGSYTLRLMYLRVCAER